MASRNVIGKKTTYSQQSTQPVQKADTQHVVFSAGALKPISDGNSKY